VLVLHAAGIGTEWISWERRGKGGLKATGFRGGGNQKGIRNRSKKGHGYVWRGGMENTGNVDGGSYIQGEASDFWSIVKSK